MTIEIGSRVVCGPLRFGLPIIALREPRNYTTVHGITGVVQPTIGRSITVWKDGETPKYGPTPKGFPKAVNAAGQVWIKRDDNDCHVLVHESELLAVEAP